MTKPKAYQIEYGFKYQILVKFPGDIEKEHCDYARDEKEKKFLLKEYRMAYGEGCQFSCILLPRYCWSKNREPELA